MFQCHQPGHADAHLKIIRGLDPDQNESTCSIGKGIRHRREPSQICLSWGAEVRHRVSRAPMASRLVVLPLPISRIATKAFADR